MAKNKGTHGRGKEVEQEPDEFVQRVTSFGDIIQPHIKKLVAVGVLALLALSAWKFMDWRGKEAAKSATTAYMGAMKIVEAPVIGTDDPPLPEGPVERLRFATEQERREASLAALAKMSGHSDIPLASLAGPREAQILLDAGKYDEAMAAYQKFAKSSAPELLRMAALEGVAYCQEAKALANKDVGARQAGLETALQSFANLQPAAGGPMRDYSLYHQGRLLVAMGKIDEGKAKYRQVLSEEPDSSLKVTIESRLDNLDAPEAPAIPAPEPTPAPEPPTDADTAE